MNFCSRYLHDIETKFNQVPRNFDDSDDQHQGGLSIFSTKGRALGKSVVKELTMEEWTQAHWYILQNCENVTPFIE